MSASAPQIPGASSDITYLTSEPFEPKPLIADILRTRFCVPNSIFLVEGVDVAHTSKSKRWRAIRLLLGDGELCIQALLSAEMHRFVDRGKIAFGSYVELQQFRVEWKDIPEGGFGEGERQMVYLVVESLAVVGWHNAFIEPLETEQTGIDSDSVEVESEAHDDPRVESSLVEPEKLQFSYQETSTHAETRDDEGQTDQDDDEFEVMAISQDKAAHNRNEAATAMIDHEQAASAPKSPPRPHNVPSRPLKLTNLRSIPNLPYKQNWSVNVLCVVSAISDVEPAGIPPYTQRQARLADPSTDKHVLLTVFLDPHLFNPAVGSVVLLSGVKNHRFDGGSLKKYASDRPKSGEDWWYENPTQLPLCDVAGLRRWWMETGIHS